MPDMTFHLDNNGSVLYNSSENIAGFQFNVDGASVVSASGGADSEHTLTISWVSRTESDNAYVVSSEVIGRDSDGNQRFLTDQSQISSSQRSSLTMTFWP